MKRVTTILIVMILALAVGWLANEADVGVSDLLPPTPKDGVVYRIEPTPVLPQPVKVQTSAPMALTAVPAADEPTAYALLKTSHESGERHTRNRNTDK